MFKTEEQASARLKSSRNLVNRFGRQEVTPSIPSSIPEVHNSIPVDNIPGAPALHHEVEIIPLHQPGNKEGKSKLSQDERNEIALRARLGEGQSILAKEFQVSQSAIGEIEQGRTKVDEVSVQAKLDQVSDVAMDKLLASLGYITPEKLDKSKATDLSMIAANMSKVVNNVRGKEAQGPQVIVQIYSPELKKESNYKMIDV